MSEEAILCTDIDQTVEDSILSQQTSVNLVPFVGQRFISQEAAYEFYCSFARQCGFSVRRHRTRGKEGVGRGVTRRDFTCHRGGCPQAKPSEDGRVQRNRKSSRCGCHAYMRIVKRVEFGIPEWRITSFSNVHNHELVKPNDVLFLPTCSTISADDKSRICMFVKAGMSVRQMLRLMELEKGVKLGCLPYTEIDVRNLLQSFSKVDEDNDAIELIAMCKRMKDENPNFSYDFKIDGYKRLEHIAWSYASSVQLYEAFGDALVFDITHRLDAYDMLLGVWIGVDNYGITCFFGCVLLRDENVQSFSWALKTFLGFMKGKAPRTIMTDQNMWLKEAIATEMPESKHAFGIWHIIAKCSDWFSIPLGSLYDEWKAEFYRLYSLEMIEEFVEGWSKMVDKYRLHANKHITSLYALRSYWALPFLRHYFCAGLTSTSQLECINAFIQRILSAQHQSDRFIERVADIVDSSYHSGEKQKMLHKLQKINLKMGSPIESHAATVLTPYAFGKLQEELVLAPQYASFIVGEGCFQVRHHTQMDGGCKVVWDPCQDVITCSCHLFEFCGILCRHILRVLSNNNCFQIPDQYFLSRWRADFSTLTKPLHITTDRGHTGKIQLLESMVSSLIAESVETVERLDVACEQTSILLSRVKGLPRSTHGVTDIVYNCSSDSLILPEVAGGIVHNFAMENHRENIIATTSLPES